MVSKTLRFIFNHVLEQWLTGGKREAKRKILRLKYFEYVKSIFHNLLRAIIWWKKINSKHKLLIGIKIKISKSFNETRSSWSL